MEGVCRVEEFEPLGMSAQEVNPFAPESGTVLQSVGTGEILFQAGQRRTLYRVERGAICHYVLWADGRHDVIEFAFPGDIIGLGHLQTHVSSAQAMTDTIVSLVSEHEFDAAINTDDRLSFRLASAVEREFDHLRDRALHDSGQGPTAKLANFLLALSNMNTPEGRDRNLIADDVRAGFVAERLDISIDKLGAALLDLKRQGAVRDTPAGLEIVDAHTLQRLADAA